jgi:hypothetical protein
MSAWRSLHPKSIHLRLFENSVNDTYVAVVLEAERIRVAAISKASGKLWPQTRPTRILSSLSTMPRSRRTAVAVGDDA